MARNYGGPDSSIMKAHMAAIDSGYERLFRGIAGGIRAYSDSRDKRIAREREDKHREEDLAEREAVRAEAKARQDREDERAETDRKFRRSYTTRKQTFDEFYANRQFSRQLNRDTEDDYRFEAGMGLKYAQFGLESEVANAKIKQERRRLGLAERSLDVTTRQGDRRLDQQDTQLAQQKRSDDKRLRLASKELGLKEKQYDDSRGDTLADRRRLENLDLTKSMGGLMTSRDGSPITGLSLASFGPGASSLLRTATELRQQTYYENIASTLALLTSDGFTGTSSGEMPIRTTESIIDRMVNNSIPIIYSLDATNPPTPRAPTTPAPQTTTQSYSPYQSAEDRRGLFRGDESRDPLPFDEFTNAARKPFQSL